jgi:hypothetical protein
MTNPSKADARRVMFNALGDGDCIDTATNEVNCTALAEAAAADLDCDDVLDDPDHPIWDWAVEVAERWEANHAVR